MATLAFNHEEITARELKPALLELDGISRESVEAHYKLYQGYVGEAERDPGRARATSTSAPRTRSTRRSARSSSTCRSRSAGSRTTRSTSSTSAAAAATPTGRSAQLIERDFGSVDAWRADLKATGMAGRGWAWTAYDWDEGRLFNYIGDAQNTFPIWNATPLVALDVYEHAYFLDYQTDRASYIDAFFDNLDWATVNDWVAVQYPASTVAPYAASDDRARSSSPATSPAACRSGTGSCALFEARGHPHASAAATSARRTSGARTARLGIPVVAARRREGLRARRSIAHARRRPARGRARRRRGDARPLAAVLPAASRRAGRWSRRAAARSSASRRSSGLVRRRGLDRRSSWLTRYASVASIVAALALPVRLRCSARAVAGDRLRRGAAGSASLVLHRAQHRGGCSTGTESRFESADGSRRDRSSAATESELSCGAGATRRSSSGARAGAPSPSSRAQLADRAESLRHHVVRVDRLQVDLAREEEVAVIERGYRSSASLSATGPNPRRSGAGDERARPRTARPAA